MLDQRRRIYALRSYTIEKKTSGWYIRRTDSDDKWTGPYRSEVSACLAIARNMKREIIRRDRLTT